MIVELRMAVERAMAMPIERRGADAALRYGFRATRRIFEGAHIRLTPSADLPPQSQSQARPLTLVRAEFCVAAIAPLREHDRAFARPRTRKDRHLETAVIVRPLDVPVAGRLAILEDVCWLGAARAHALLTSAAPLVRTLPDAPWCREWLRSGWRPPGSPTATSGTDRQQ